MAIEPKLRKDIVNFLINIPSFQSENGRKAILLSAGLDNVLPTIDLSGSTTEFVSLLVERLDQYGTLSDQQPALIRLLQGVMAQVGLDRQETLQAFCEWLADQAEQAKKFAETCPYRGLSAFREQDEPFFFGREACTEKVVETLQKRPFVAVIGASGSGKSSLVYAGLIPRLRRQSTLEGGRGVSIPSWEGQEVGSFPSSEGSGVDIPPLRGARGVSSQEWVIISFRPGEHPLRSLSSALLPFLEPNLREVDQMVEINKLTENLQSGQLTLPDVLERIRIKQPDSRILIFVDQFEEVYALCDDAEERQRFLDELLSILPNSPSPQLPISVIITLRSDFLGHTNSYPELSHLIADNEVIVPAMNTEELRRAIAEPAKRAEHPLSEEVVELLIEQSAGREGALPLLEFALTRIWEGMANGVGSADTLKQIGGVGGALANKAQELFDSLNEPEQQIARRAFLAMIRLGEGTKDTRRRVQIADIVAHKDDPQQVRRVLNHFAQPGARLISLADDSAEITHEALFDHWDTLKSWLNESRDDLRFHRRLADATQYWDDHNRPEGLLWRPPDLELLQQYHHHNQQDMTALQVVFFQESDRKQRQTTGLKRITMAILAILTLISVIGAIWAIQSERKTREAEQNARNSERIARKQRDEADKAKREAEINEIEALVQTSKALFLTHNELGALLAGVKAGIKLKQIGLSKNLENIVIFNILKTFYDIHEKNRLEYQKDYVRSVTFSPDGKILAVGSRDGKITLWNVINGRKITTLSTFYGSVRSLSFNPNGVILASGDQKGTITLWDIVKHKKITSLTGHSNSVLSVVFNSDGTLLASGSADKTIKLWSVKDNREIITLRGHNDVVWSVTFNHDSTLLASGSADKTIKLWSVTTGKKIIELHGHSKAIRSVVFNPDNITLASGSEDNQIKLWHLPDGNEISTLQGHSFGVRSITFDPDGKILASGGGDKTIKLWDISNSKEILILQGHSDLINTVIFNPDGTTLASGSSDTTARLWDIENNKKFIVLRQNSGAITALAFSPDNTMLASVNRNKIVRIQHISNGEESFVLNSDFNSVLDIAFNPDSSKLALGNQDGSIILWDIVNKKKITSLQRNSVGISCVAFDLNRMILASGNKTIKLWSLTDNTASTLLQGHKASITNITFSPDGSMLASGGEDNTVKLWSIESSKELFTLKGHSGWINSTAFSHDGKKLASGSSDTEIKLWNTKDGKKITTLHGHSDSVRCIAFNPEGTILASGSADAAIKIWNMEDEKEITTLKGHSDSVNKVCFSPNGKLLASGNDDGTIVLWSLNLDDLLVRSCKWLHGYLKHNPNISDEDRTLCDDILNDKD